MNYSSHDDIATWIHVPIPRSGEDLARDFYEKSLGLKRNYSEFLLTDDGLIRLQLKFVDQIEAINALGPSSLCSVFLAGDFLALCDRWVRCGVTIDLLQLDPGGFTAVVLDPFRNRLEFRGDEETSDFSVDTSHWPFFRRL
ncbi:hypothetical protein SAMN05192589_1234 [Paracidovorax valerianellae]|uniref:VOC domain-containing protein n=1 Tax=Paracidovorax valerianellae TaxID=187868 RepID=A0A1G7EEZ6_9BURK|nr:hypothetical protein [Paracidovorax valerianellae]SDE62224.1 hypothetical protein SAMN05192589_1234 [Paracidovorax valerianellae]